MNKQVRTSAGTSINSTKLPRVYNSFGIKGNILDYGCGRYTDHIRDAVGAAGFKFYGYDPYNQSADVNAENMRAAAENRDVEYVYCSNVLNVIDSDDVVRDLAGKLLNLAENLGATLVVTVYEGDKSGTGRETKADCYQRNEPVSSYLKYFNATKSNVKKGCIVVRPVTPA